MNIQPRIAASRRRVLLEKALGIRSDVGIGMVPSGRSKAFEWFVGIGIHRIRALALAGAVAVGCAPAMLPDVSSAASTSVVKFTFVPGTVVDRSVIRLSDGRHLGIGADGDLYQLNASLQTVSVFWQKPSCAIYFPVDVTAGPSGIVYVTGYASGDCIPTTANAVQSHYAGGGDAFALELSADGAVVYGSYLGGTGLDRPSGVSFDADGDIYVKGVTNSPDFPFDPPVQDKPSASHPVGFVSRISADTGLVYSVPVDAEAMAPGDQGDLYVSGPTYCGQLQATANALQRECPADLDDSLVGFLEKLAPDGSVLYASYLAGGKVEHSSGGIQTDACCISVRGDTVTVAGTVDSPGFPVRNARQRHFGGDFGSTIGNSPGGDGFVARIDGTGKTIFSTYLGGGGNEEIRGLALDPAGHIFVVGGTDSAKFPMRNAIRNHISGPVSDTALCGNTDNDEYCRTRDGFVTELGAKGGLTFSTYLGGKETDESWSVAARSGKVDVLSITKSANFLGISPANAHQNPHGGNVLSTITLPTSDEPTGYIPCGVPRFYVWQEDAAKYVEDVLGLTPTGTVNLHNPLCGSTGDACAGTGFGYQSGEAAVSSPDSITDAHPTARYPSGITGHYYWGHAGNAVASPRVLLYCEQREGKAAMVRLAS